MSFKVHKDVQEPYYNEFKDLDNIDELIVSIQGEDRWSIDTVEINRMILRKRRIKK